MLIEHNLAVDLAESPEILVKVKGIAYAQNLYAALCNNEWQKREVFPILNDDSYLVSWRTAGAIGADLRAIGEDYMAFFCSGIQSDDDLLREGYVVEGTVTDEIKTDLSKLNWYLINNNDDGENT